MNVYGSTLDSSDTDLVSFPGFYRYACNNPYFNPDILVKSKPKEQMLATEC